MDKEFRQTRKPINPSEIPDIMSAPPSLNRDTPPPTMDSQRLSSLPPALAMSMQKMNELRENKEAPPPSREMPMGSGPKLAFTGDNKFDQLLAGIKDIVYRYEKVELPSRGRFYTDNIAPLDGIIHVRKMTGEEDGIIGTHRYVKNGNAIDMIFRNCVRENISTENLLNVDRTWLLIYLRGISHSTEFETEVKCPECGAKFNTEIDLDALPVTPCPDTFTLESLKDTLPTTGYSFSYRLLTGADEKMIADYREKRTRGFDSNAIDDTWAFKLAILTNEIEGLTDKNLLKSLIIKLPVSDSSYLRNALSEPPFGVNTKIDMICPSCYEEFKLELPMDINFFFPKPRKARTTQA